MYCHYFLCRMAPEVAAVERTGGYDMQVDRNICTNSLQLYYCTDKTFDLAVKKLRCNAFRTVMRQLDSSSVVGNKAEVSVMSYTIVLVYSLEAY